MTTIKMRIENLRQLEILCQTASADGDCEYWRRFAIAAAVDFTNWEYGVPQTWQEAIRALANYRFAMRDLITCPVPYETANLDFCSEAHKAAEEFVSGCLNYFHLRWRAINDCNDRAIEEACETAETCEGDFAL